MSPRYFSLAAASALLSASLQSAASVLFGTRFFGMRCRLPRSRLCRHCRLPSGPYSLLFFGLVLYYRYRRRLSSPKPFFVRKLARSDISPSQRNSRFPQLLDAWLSVAPPSPSALSQSSSHRFPPSVVPTKCLHTSLQLKLQYLQCPHPHPPSPLRAGERARCLYATFFHLC